MRVCWTAILSVVIPLVLGANAHAEKRVALVIGNGAYTEISPLENPRNDAELMAGTLEDLGFDVVLTTDADRVGMGRAIRKFGKSLRLSGKDTVGLLYYAGHGVQSGGANYLIPIGASIEDDADLRIEALSVSDILAQMETAGNRLNLVILDACRNNPFKGRIRSAVRGLARIQAASGSMVAFSAAPGQVATDGKGSNSPYTAALAKAMRQPNLTVEQVFKRVRVAVETHTGGAQTPWEESSLRGDFYFAGKPAAPVAAGRDDQVELAYWNTIKDSGDAALFEFYLEQYPNGLFAALARTMMARLKADSADTAKARDAERETAQRATEIAYWNSVRDSNNPDLIRLYLERFPNGVFSSLAKALLARLEGDPGTADEDPFREQRSAAVDTVPEAASPAARAAVPDPFDVAEDEAEPSNRRTAVAPGSITEPDPDLPRKIQTALAEAGCDPGPIDGKWGRRSTIALDRFTRHAKVAVPDEPVSQETLGLFDGVSGRVCPLECGPRRVERNGRCVIKTCPAGRVLTPAGICRRTARIKRSRTAPPSETRPRRKRPPKFGTTHRSVPSQY